MDRAPKLWRVQNSKNKQQADKGRIKILHSPAGNQTQVFRVTGKDTHYYTTYTTEDSVADLEIQKGGFSHWRAMPAR